MRGKRHDYFQKYYKENKEKVLAKNRKYNREHRNTIRQQEAERGYSVKTVETRFNNYLKRMYGITKEQYDQMHAEQNGVCAICREPETRKSPKSSTILNLLVDHNHSTDKVRQLICHRCNTALGLFQDSSLLCRAAANYLEKHACLTEI